MYVAKTVALAAQVLHMQKLGFLMARLIYSQDNS